MRRRLLLYPLAVTSHGPTAAASRWVWGERRTPAGQRYYVLTPLGVLNTLRERVGLRPWAA